MNTIRQEAHCWRRAKTATDLCLNMRPGSGAAHDFLCIASFRENHFFWNRASTRIIPILDSGLTAKNMRGKYAQMSQNGAAEAQTTPAPRQGRGESDKPATGSRCRRPRPAQP